MGIVGCLGWDRISGGVVMFRTIVEIYQMVFSFVGTKAAMSI
jgi:hypothetical protein